MSVYQVKLQTLSPVHIGDGGELRQGFDFMVRGNATYRLNEDAILQAKEAQVRPDRYGHYPTPGALLQEADYERDAYFRYILRGAARSAKLDARLKSFIKDVYDRPYIPGSSLKGALRTALAWTGSMRLPAPCLTGSVRGDIILLDNMNLAQLRQAVQECKDRVLTEASGGVTLSSVRAIAETDVDFISVGALTHSARAVDIGLDFEL